MASDQDKLYMGVYMRMCVASDWIQWETWAAETDNKQETSNARE